MRTPRIVLALIAVCLAAPAAAAAAPSATLSPVESGARVVVRVEIANPEAEPIRVLRRAVGAGSLADPAFVVTRDGEPVAHVGALAKHGPPVDADYLAVPARGTASLDVELSGAYAFTRTATYAIRLVASDPALVLDADGGVVATALRSEELTIAADAQPGPVPSPVRPSAVRPIGTLSLSFTNCSAVAPGGGVASEQDRIAQAIVDATAYVDAASEYFLDRRAGARYVEWFGVRTPARWNAVRDNYARALAAFETASIRVECHNARCGVASTYAYVYPADPYAIYVCGGFWSAPAIGTDSKAGTLVHEMMHFTVVAETADHAYGQIDARNLAVANPSDAVDNSDNYEYFAENETPVTVDNAPAVVVDTAQQGFGERTVGTTATGTAITVRNSGDAAMTIGALTVAAPFSIDQDACSSRILAAGMSCTFAVAFAPQEAGAASGSVAIPTDARVAADAIAVTGTGVAVPAPEPAPVVTNAPAPVATPAAVRARAVRGGIRVVLPTGTRSFRLQVRRDGRWVPAGLYRAPTGTRTVQVKRGSYRVIVTGATPVAVRV